MNPFPLVLLLPWYFVEVKFVVGFLLHLLYILESGHQCVNISLKCIDPKQKCKQYRLITASMVQPLLHEYAYTTAAI